MATRMKTRRKRQSCRIWHAWTSAWSSARLLCLHTWRSAFVSTSTHNTPRQLTSSSGHWLRRMRAWRRWQKWRRKMWFTGC